MTLDWFKITSELCILSQPDIPKLDAKESTVLLEFIWDGIACGLWLGSSICHSLWRLRHFGHPNVRIYLVAPSVRETQSSPERGVVTASPFSLSRKDTANQDRRAKPTGTDTHREGGTPAVPWAGLAGSERWLCHRTFCDGLSENYSA